MEPSQVLVHGNLNLNFLSESLSRFAPERLLVYSLYSGKDRSAYLSICPFNDLCPFPSQKPDLPPATIGGTI